MFNRGAVFGGDGTCQEARQGGGVVGRLYGLILSSPARTARRTRSARRTLNRRLIARCDDLGRTIFALRGVFIIGGDARLALGVFEAAIAFVATTLPAFAATFATAAFSALAVGAAMVGAVTIPVAITIAVTIGLALGAFGLTASFILDAAFFSLLGGDDGCRLCAGLVLEVDIETLARLLALSDFAH